MVLPSLSGRLATCIAAQAGCRRTTPLWAAGLFRLRRNGLSLKSYGANLNPVAVTINKAMIEIPPRFHGQKPVNPLAANSADALWPGTQGLADDIAYYGGLLKKLAQERLISLYPKAKHTNPETSVEEEVTVIAWLWARALELKNLENLCFRTLAASEYKKAKLPG